MKKKILIVSISTILLLLILFLCNLTIKIDVSNIPDKIEYNSNVDKPQAYLSGRVLFGNLMEIDVKEENENNFSKIGKLVNKYNANFLFYKNSVQKEIEIVDTQKPRIELVYKENYYTLPNTEYIEEGYMAYDDYDGDITSNVTKEIKDNKIYYSVTDSSGNTEVAERTIKYDDPIAPELTLIGENKITINQGDTYIEKGASAIDNCDGNITEKIVISGVVDAKTAGTYTIKYFVTDNNGNGSETVRTVVVKEFIEPSGEGRTIYLTFDDGPSAYTNELLDTLKKYNIKATFFVVGYKCDETILKRIVGEGHSIGLHSTNHSYKDIYNSEQAFVDDLYKMQNIVKEKSGFETFLLRFPGGSSNTVSKNYCKGIMSKLTKKVEELGFEYFDWNVSSGDAGGATTTEQVIKNIKTGVRKYANSVVLQHDTQKFSVDAVEYIIKWGLENGYSFAGLNCDSPKAHHGVNK